METNIVKWTTPYPCLVLNESDPKLCTNFEFFLREKSWTLLEKNINLQSQAVNDDKNNSKKILHILEDGASGVQIVDIEQAIA
jgi:hypothetical protein